MRIRYIFLVTFYLVLLTGCANSHDYAQKVWGGSPVIPTCEGSDRGIDWTRLEKNGAYFGKFQEYGVRIKEGDDLSYVNKGVTTTIKIRTPKEGENGGRFGYVIEYQEEVRGGMEIYTIPLIQDVRGERVEMCGGNKKRYDRYCGLVRQYMIARLDKRLYQSPEAAQGSVLNLYGDGLLPDFVFNNDTSNCGLLQEYRDHVKSLQQRHGVCYQNTGRLCKN